MKEHKPLITRLLIAYEITGMPCLQEAADTLQDIVRAYDSRSELYTDDATCAAALADKARKAID
jgi:hypothetical protein